MLSLPWANNAQLDFLKGWWVNFANSQNDKCLQKFWSEINRDFFERWLDPVSERQNLTVKEKKILVSTEGLSEEEWVALHKKSIYNWFNNNRSSKKKWGSHAVRISIPQSATRLSTEAHLYSKRYYKSRVKPLVEAKIGDRKLKCKQCIAIVNKHLTECFKNESTEIREEIKKAREEERAAKEVAQGLDMAVVDAIQELTPDQMLIAQLALPDVLADFCKEMGKCTGWSFAIMAGGPDARKNGDIATVSVHTGQDKFGQTFHRAYKDYKSSVKSPFSNHLDTVYSACVCQKFTLAGTTAPSTVTSLTVHGLAAPPAPAASVAAPKAIPNPAASVAAPKVVPEPAASVAALKVVPEPAASVAALKVVPEPAASVAALKVVPEPAASVAALKVIPEPAASAPTLTAPATANPPPAFPPAPVPAAGPANPSATTSIHFTSKANVHDKENFTGSIQNGMTYGTTGGHQALQTSYAGNQYRCHQALQTSYAGTQYSTGGHFTFDSTYNRAAFNTGGFEAPYGGNEYYTHQNYIPDTSFRGIQHNVGQDEDFNGFNSLTTPDWPKLDAYLDTMGPNMANPRNWTGVGDNQLQQQIFHTGHNTQLLDNAAATGSTTNSFPYMPDVGFPHVDIPSLSVSLPGASVEPVPHQMTETPSVTAPVAAMLPNTVAPLAEDETTEGSTLEPAIKTGTGTQGRALGSRTQKPPMPKEVVPLVEKQLKEPEWIVAAHEYLKGGINLSEWDGMVKAWFTFETDSGLLETPSQRLSPKNRPLLLSKWLSNCHQFSLMPQVNDVAAFGVEWRTWWNSMQPKWCQVSAPGTLPQPVSVVKNFEDLTSIKKAGPVGLVVAIISLKWWAGDGQNTDWLKAITDVVMHQF